MRDALDKGVFVEERAYGRILTLFLGHDEDYA